LAYAYLTKADIERERSELQNAERYARRALNIFTKLKDRKGEAQAYRTLANIYRYLHKFEQALKYLKRGILLVESESRNSLSLLASLYQLYGRLCRHYSTFIKEEMELQVNNSFNEIPALYHDARFALQDSVSLAQKAGNRWEVARSQIEIALIMLIGDDPLNTTELNELLDQVWQTANDLGDELLMGYVYENRARLAMKNKNYIEAGRMIGDVAHHISRRTGHESLRAFSRLHKFLLNDELSTVDRDALAVGVLQTLTRQDCQGHPALIALINMCEQILALPKL
jgi:tetratricopeptide (TPR) repeat protein